MKQIKITTDKGEFLLVDGDVAKGGIKHEDKIYYYFCDAKNITEEQASEIVDYFTEYSKRYQDYERLEFAYLTAIESLHSLLKSKGIHLFRNPNNSDYFTNRSTEQKAFYNPFIFKL